MSNPFLPTEPVCWRAVIAHQTIFKSRCTHCYLTTDNARRNTAELHRTEPSDQVGYSQVLRPWLLPLTGNETTPSKKRNHEFDLH